MKFGAEISCKYNKSAKLQTKSAMSTLMLDKQKTVKKTFQNRLSGATNTFNK